MHPRVIGERNEEARRRIKTAAQSLSQTLNIPEMGALTFAEQRDTMVAQMRELEILADVLEFASENAANVATLLQNAPKTFDDFYQTATEDEQAAILETFRNILDEQDAPADETEAHEPDTDGEIPKRSPGRPRKSR